MTYKKSQKSQKSLKNFIVILVTIKTCKKCDYEKHLQTQKHKNNTILINDTQKAHLLKCFAVNVEKLQT